SRRFGNANPEPMNLSFWRWMIEGDGQDSYIPYQARKMFGAESDSNGPVWSFGRMGKTKTQVADGRTIHIAGEYEDSYDPDFCIYNDVIVFSADGQFTIYGYPESTFPPTDFHSASVVEDKIVLIGTVGYHGKRTQGVTPVYSLNLSSYSISQMLTTGDAPGWISKHSAEAVGEGTIRVTGGEVFEIRDGKQHFIDNYEDYLLEVENGLWRRLTNRNWRQYSITAIDRELFVLERNPDPKSLTPRSVALADLQDLAWNAARFYCDGLWARVTVDISSVNVVVESSEDGASAQSIAREIKDRVEDAIKKACVLTQLR
ncbi:MAG: hypothetical protein ACRD3E_00905, partial [Terriglobales bacterium]